MEVSPVFIPCLPTSPPRGGGPAGSAGPTGPAGPAAAAVAAGGAGAPAGRPLPSVDPVTLHPALWRAHQLGRAGPGGGAAALATGFGALDAELPGGGWPAGTLTELLLVHPGVGEWRLLAPALAAIQRGRGPDAPPRPLMLFGPPGRPCGWALAALGLDLRQLVLVRGRVSPSGQGRGLPRGQGQGSPRGKDCAGAVPQGTHDLLWSLEQALASGQVGAALAWLPSRLPADALRRLQLAAQAHPGPVFLFREVDARGRPSTAPLRLQLAPGAPDELLVHVFKRRGPPRDQPLALALPPVLSVLARERAAARQQAQRQHPERAAQTERAGWPGGGAGPAAGRAGTLGRADRPGRPGRHGRPDRPAPTVPA